MLILSFDTATKALSVALTEKGIRLDTIESFSEKTHSERLMPAIDEILKRNEVSLEDVSLIAVGNGPGSYTGIRIALSTALGLVHSTRTPLITVSTLEAMTSGEEAIEIPLLDARGGRLYAAIYMGENVLKAPQQTTAAILAREIVDKRLELPVSREIRLLGDGAPLLSAALSEQKDNHLLSTALVDRERYPSAVRLAILAERRFAERCRGLSADEVKPLYAAVTQAERLRQT